MALSIDLKPGERIIIGEALITNTGARAKFSIQGDVPILREKDILTPEIADSPAKRVYLAVQLMYLENDIETMRETYFQLTGDIVQAAPSTVPYIERISSQLISGAFYKALKEAKALIAYESELLSHATSGSPRLRTGPKNHRQPANAGSRLADKGGITPPSHRGWLAANKRRPAGRADLQPPPVDHLRHLRHRRGNPPAPVDQAEHRQPRPVHFQADAGARIRTRSREADGADRHQPRDRCRPACLVG